MATNNKRGNTPEKAVASSSHEQGKWRVIRQGRARTLATSKASLKVIKQTVRVYASALRRLADR
jgi:hypothetical protein